MKLIDELESIQILLNLSEIFGDVMSYRNDLFDKAMKACGIKDSTDEDKEIRRGFHDFLHDVYPDTKDEMSYQELLEAAKEYLRSVDR